MKKIIIVFLIALGLGSIMGYFFYKKYQNPFNKASLWAYQVGAYNAYENALNKALELNGALIIKSDDKYQVIAALASKTNVKNKIETMLNNESIHYYKKEILLNKEALDVVSDYEVMIDKTENESTIELINQKLLEELQEKVK